MSPVGLALLFDQAGGQLNGKMQKVVDEYKINNPLGEKLIE